MGAMVCDSTYRWMNLFANRLSFYFRFLGSDRRWDPLEQTPAEIEVA